MAGVAVACLPACLAGAWRGRPVQVSVLNGWCTGTTMLRARSMVPAPVTVVVRPRQERLLLTAVDRPSSATESAHQAVMRVGAASVTSVR